MLTNQSHVFKFSISLILFYYLLLVFFPDGTFNRIISTTISFIGTGLSIFLIYNGYKRSENKEKKFWMIIFFGIVFYGIGEISWELSSLFYNELPSGELFPNIFYILQLFVVLISLIYLSIQDASKTHIAISIVDILVSLIILYTLTWPYFIQPLYEANQITWIDALISLSYPLLELLIVAGLLQYVYLHDKKIISKKSLQWMAISLGIYFITDLANFSLKYLDITEYIIYLEPLWLLSIMLFGLSSCFPKETNSRSIVPLSRRKDIFKKHILPFLSIFMMTALFVPFLSKANILVYGLIICFFLIMIRQYILLRENQQLTDLLMKTSSQLEEKNQELHISISNLETINRIRELEARTDFLTGVCNRRYIDSIIRNCIQNAEENHSTFSVLLFDIDYFKGVNDKYGHDVGDQVLIYLTKRLNQSIRKSDYLGRLGGEEFIVILDGTPIVAAGEIAERIRNQFEQNPISLPNCKIPITLSIGVTAYQEGDTFDGLYKRVDEALYDAKKMRNKVSLYVG